MSNGATGDGRTIRSVGRRPDLSACWIGFGICWAGLLLSAWAPLWVRASLTAVALVVAAVGIWRLGLSSWVAATLAPVFIINYVFIAEGTLAAAPHLLTVRLEAALVVSAALLVGALSRSRKKIEDDLQRTLQHLEERVWDRTQELSAANGALRAQIEQRLKAEQERESLEVELRQAHKLEAIGRLAGGVAHDFNNLLMVIQGYADLLRSRLPPDDGHLADLSEITKAAERGSALTRQLLAFGRKQVLRISPLDLNVVVGETSEMLRPLIGESIQLRVNLAQSACAIEADRAQLEQVLVNLTVNARDAMAQGGVLTIDVSTVSLEGGEPALEPGRYARLRLVDTGCGMDDSTKARVFEPFFTTKEVGKGSGLGLATVYGIVKQLGGHVEVESAPRQGTAFTIYFPETRKPVVLEEDVVRGPVAFGTETVLLVEDDEPVRALTRDVLARHGYRILEAENPRRALEIAASHKGEIDLVLTDVVMPGMTGPEMVALLQETHPEPRVLYASGYATEALVRDGMLPHGVALVQKPVTARELLADVRVALDAKPRVDRFELSVAS